MYVNEHTWQHAKPKRTKQRKDNMYALFVLYIIVSYVVIVCSWVSQNVHMFSYIYMIVFVRKSYLFIYLEKKTNKLNSCTIYETMWTNYENIWKHIGTSKTEQTFKKKNTNICCMNVPYLFFPHLPGDGL